MGIFKKTQGLLPNAPRSQYPPVEFPDSGAMIMLNLYWAKKEMDKGRGTDFALDLVMSAMSVENFRHVAFELIMDVPSIVIERMQLENSAEIFEKLQMQAATGSALALLERADGVQVQGFVHPSIWNAFYPSKPSGLKGLNEQIAVDKCIEIGYYLAAGYFNSASDACERLKPLND